MRQPFPRNLLGPGQVAEQRCTPDDHAVGVDLLHHGEAVVECEALFGVRETSSPVVRYLSGPGEGVECHALQVGVIQALGDDERPFGRGVGLCPFLAGRPTVTGPQPEWKKPLGCQVRRKNVLVGHVFGDCPCLATQADHLLFRWAIRNRTLESRWSASPPGF